ncbi:MAG: DUF1684 domain-containing protein [Promethearchaeota archaeon]
MENTDWMNNLQLEREQKDKYFALHPQSPIPLKNREKFNKLEYYPPNPHYRFKLKLKKHPKMERIQMIYSGGQKRQFLKWGEFLFEINGKQHVLQAYKSNADEGRLFIPFRDATTGTETYSAGRYLDLELERDYTSDGKWILDFNKAYNPWCAYNEDYTCPFVPPENWLEVPILAGEKKPLLK